MEDQKTLDSPMAQKTLDLETERRNKKRGADGRYKIGWKLETDVSSDLLLQTSFDMYLINLEEFGPDFEKWNPLDPEDLKHPPLASSLHFFEKRLPIGMGSFKSGDYVCMIGGEKLREDVRQLPKVINPFGLDSYLDTSEGDRNQGTSRDVFACKLGPSKELLLEPIDAFPKLKTGKARPLVELIEGKIFVHHSMGTFHSGWDNPDPVFEVYIRSLNSWLEIVDVPYVTRSNGLVTVPSYSGFGHFVIGCKLFIPDLEGLHCFDAVTMKWDDNSSSNLLRSVKQARLGHPLFGRCVTGLGLEDNGYYAMVYLQDRGCFRTARPYACLIDQTGRLLCYQDLEKQLFNDFLPYLVPGVESRFLDLGSGNMCAVICGKDAREIDVVLHICFFSFETLPNHVNDLLVNPPSSPIKKEFLEIETFNKYFCKLTGLGHYILPCLVNAFFL